MTTIAATYRRPWLDPGDALFLRCLTGSAIAAVLFVALVRLLPTPAPRPLTQVDQLPQRFAKLILEPTKAPAPPPPPAPAPAADRVRSGVPQAAAGGGTGAEAAPAMKPAPAAGAPAGNRRVESMHALPGGGGSAGTARARAEVSAQLAGTAASLKSALAGLNASLGTTSSATGGSVSRGGRARAVRGAAGVADLDRVSGSLATAGGASGVGTGGGGDLGGSAVAGSLVSIGDLAVSGGTGDGSGTGTGGGSGGGLGSGTGSGTGGGAGGGSVAGPGVHRSNASLLQVIQRYAPGIQFCYGNELKRDPSLRGKLVMALVVAASGEVTEARVVLNNTGSAQLATCALAQVRDWRFPAIASGVTTFQAPFVFTPPQ